MDISLSLQEHLTQQLILSPQILQSIRILNLSIVDLHEYIVAEIEKNPLIDFPTAWEPRSCGAGLIESITRSDAPTLRDDLRFQLHVSFIEKTYMSIGEYIIDCINDRGYLCERIDELAEQMCVPISSIRRVLDLIQTFEPIGVGASSINECLAIQLQILYQKNTCVTSILKNHLNDLVRNRMDTIAMKTGFSLEEIHESAQIIQSLSLYPGDNYGHEPVHSIVPEILVSVEAHSLLVQLINELPAFVINDTYAEFAAGNEEAEEYIQQKMNQAKWLLHCVGQRSSTLLKVATCIIQRQQAHFLTKSAPFPLTHELIATDLAIHPSTVSRAINERFYEHDSQVHSFKVLFPSKLKSGESDAQIKVEILALIKREDRKFPLSDQQIADILNSRQMLVARRTIAKYRTEMNIAPACRRK